MKKQLISLLLTIAMVLGSFTACSTTTTPAPTKEKEADTKQTPADTKQSEKSESPTADNPPTIVIYNNSGAFSVAGAEAGSDAAAYKEMQDYILKETGIKVEVIMPPSDAGASTEKLNLLLAGGDQIDAWWGNWRDYANDGIIIPLTDYVKSPEAKALYDLWEPWGAWEKVSDETGTIWAIPRMTDTTPYPVFVRNDWLAQLNMEMPKTLEELNKYLYQVKTKDLYGNGETIPLILEKGGSGNVLDRAEYTFLGGFVKTGNNKWLDPTDNKIKPEWIADGYTDFLKQLHQWYKDGIIHKESFTMDADTIKQNISKGSVGATCVWYSRVTLTDHLLRENLPNFDRKVTPYVFGIQEAGLTGANGNLLQTTAKSGSTGLVISSKCKHPEAVMKFVEWSFEWENYVTEMHGLKDKYWKYDPAIENAEQLKRIVKIEGNPTYARDFLVSLGLPLEVQTTEYDDEKYQRMHNFWLQNHLDDYQTTLPAGAEKGIVWDSAALTENIPNLTDLETYKDEELIKFITGSRSFDTWDAFLKECEQLGLNDYIAEYTRQYNALHQ